MRPLRNIFYKLSRTEQRREGVAAYLWLHAFSPTFPHGRKLFAAAAAPFKILSSFTLAIKSIKTCECINDSCHCCSGEFSTGSSVC